SVGSDGTFHTQPWPAPSVGTATVSAVSRTGANGSAQVDPNNLATRVHVEYGTTTAYGQATSDVALASTTGSQAFSAQLAGLAPGTLVHYRVVAANATGTTPG